MIIKAITEPDKLFVYTCTGRAFENLSTYIDCETRVEDYKVWSQTIHVEEDVDVFIFESVYLELTRFTTAHLRHFYPNAKLVAMGSDTIYFIGENKNGGYQFNSPLDVDLFLEKMDDCIEEYERRGVNVDNWMWTISDWMIEYLKKFELVSFDEREYDFIGVYAPHTIQREGSYRNRMVRHIEDAGFRFTQGGGSGHEDNDLDRLLNMYCNSKFTLGTTSHDNPKFHGMKGFRDWIGPFLGSLLIYDDYKDVIKRYDGRNTVPVYPYDDFDVICSDKPNITSIHNIFSSMHRARNDKS
jgi:hypothetical protein